MAVQLRPATPADTARLSELAFRSKAHWGYDAAFMESCRADLSVSPADLTRHRVCLAEQGGRLLGFFELEARLSPDLQLWLGKLFVSPEAIGQGVGRLLWDQALREVAELGQPELWVDSDPSAEGFYLSRGAVRVGEYPSSAVPGRMLPLLRYRRA